MQVINNHTTLGEQVIKTLLYFDIFNYPLKAKEIFKFLRINSTSEMEVGFCLNALKARNQVFRFGDFYSLHEDDKIIQRRIKGNAEADKYLIVAKRKGQFIHDSHLYGLSWPLVPYLRVIWMKTLISTFLL